MQPNKVERVWPQLVALCDSRDIRWTGKNVFSASTGIARTQPPLLEDKLCFLTIKSIIFYIKIINWICDSFASLRRCYLQARFSLLNVFFLNFSPWYQFGFFIQFFSHLLISAASWFLVTKLECKTKLHWLKASPRDINILVRGTSSWGLLMVGNT